jgi:hypothetical protein
MKRVILAVLMLVSIAAHAITNMPPSLISTTGSTSGQVIASSGPSGAAAWTTVTLSGLGGLAASNNLSDVANASTSRTNLGLGTAAVANIGTSGANVPLLNAANNWSVAQTFTIRPTFNGNTPYDTGNTVAVANGGTGQTTQSAALTALLGSSLVPIANGGTNAGTAATARTNLGAAASGANSDITSLNAPALGSATAATATAGTNTTQVATTAFTETAVAAVTPTAMTNYTPTVTATSGTFTTASATGHYYVIGKMVYVEVTVTITTVGTASGNVFVTLPIATNSSAGITITPGRENGTTGKALVGFANANSTSMSVAFYDNSSPILAGYSLVLSGCYTSN